MMDENFKKRITKGIDPKTNKPILGEIYVDVQGKEIFSSVEKDVRGSYTKQFNLEDISKGMYYIILSSGSEIKTQKLIIQ